VFEFIALAAFLLGWHDSSDDILFTANILMVLMKVAFELRGLASASGRLAILFIVITISRTSGQENTVGLRHGTIIVYELNTTQLVIVADSKVHVVGDSEVKGLEDGLGCKIVNLSNNTLFFYTGNFTEAYDKTGKTTFSQQNAATEAFEKFKTEGRSKKRLMDVANKYSELVRPKIDEILRAGFKYDVGALAGFASLDEFNHPTLLRVNFGVEPLNHTVGSTVMPLAPDADHVYMGRSPAYEGVIEFIAAKTPRAKQAMEQFKSRREKLPERDKEVYRLIAAVMSSLNWNKNDPTVGPPVDAVVIEANMGIRWIKRKPMCRSAAFAQ
jgi:hypothetical protein